MTKTSFGEQLQQIWHTRPVRLPRQGPVAGVAAGFGQRYNIDPVLVRIAFVVSTLFGGAGIVLYLAAWLMFSQAGDETSAAESLFGKGHSSQSQTKTVVLIVALAIAVSTMGPFGVGLAGSGLISLALMLAGWWMLYMRTPQPPPGTSGLDNYGFDGGLTATGYPGAVFPTGATGSFYAPETPPTNMYTPYTKLPDAYIPDASFAHHTPPVSEQTDAETALNADAVNVQLHKGDAETVLLDKNDSETVLLDKDTSETAVPDKNDSDTAVLDKNASSTANDPAAQGTPLISPATAGPATDTAAGTDTGTAARTGSGSAQTPASTTTPAEDTTGPSLIKNADGSPAEGPGAKPSESAPQQPPTRTVEPARPALSGGPTPPSWDPLGVAPLAWDLPDPSPVRTVVAPPAKRPRSRLTPVVLGLAILAAAGAGAAAASGVEWMTPGRIAAVALAVVGLGLVLGAFLRRGYGLLVVTAPLAGFVLLASLVGPIEFDQATMGDRTWAPTSLSDLQAEYHLSMGEGTLDLRGLNLTENRSVDLSVQMGEARVLIPAGMTVNTQCNVAMGDESCPKGITGPNTPGAPVLDLNVDVRMGEVVVERG